MSERQTKRYRAVLLVAALLVALGLALAPTGRADRAITTLCTISSTTGECGLVLVAGRLQTDTTLQIGTTGTWSANVTFWVSQDGGVSRETLATWTSSTASSTAGGVVGGRTMYYTVAGGSTIGATLNTYSSGSGKLTVTPAGEDTSVVVQTMTPTSTATPTATSTATPTPTPA